MKPFNFKVLNIGEVFGNNQCQRIDEMKEGCLFESAAVAVIYMKNCQSPTATQRFVYFQSFV